MAATMAALCQRRSVIILPSCISRTSRYAAFGDLVLDYARPARAPPCRWACSPSAVTPIVLTAGAPRERPRSHGYPGHGEGEGEGVVHVQETAGPSTTTRPGRSAWVSVPVVRMRKPASSSSSAIRSSHPCPVQRPLAWSLPLTGAANEGRRRNLLDDVRGHRELPGAVVSACPLIGQPYTRRRAPSAGHARSPCHGRSAQPGRSRGHVQRRACPGLLAPSGTPGGHGQVGAGNRPEGSSEREWAYARHAR